MPRLLTDTINGPHFILEGEAEPWAAEPTKLRIRQFYAGNGKVHLTFIDGRKTADITLDAADLVDAVLSLLPDASKTNN